MNTQNNNIPAATLDMELDAAKPIPALAIPLLSLAALGASASARVTDPLLSRLALEFNISIGDASATVTLFAIAYGLSLLLFGPLGDRYGKYLVVAYVCVASALASLFCALALNFPMLLAGRLLAGAAVAAIIPLSMAWIGDAVPYHLRQPILARFMVGQMLGITAGMFVGGLAADTVGWRMPFFALTLIFLISGIALLYLNRRLPNYARATRKGEGPAMRRLATDFKLLTARPWARVVLLAVFIEGAFLFGALAFIPTHVYRTHGISQTAAGSLVMLFGLGGLLYAAASGLLVKRLGEPGMTICGGVFGASMLLLIATAPAWWWAIPACLVVGIGFYMMHNTLQINATQMAPEQRGAAVSTFACSLYLGQAAGVGMAGLVVEQAGTVPILVAGAFGVLLLGILFSRALRSRPVQ